MPCCRSGRGGYLSLSDSPEVQAPRCAHAPASVSNGDGGEADVGVVRGVAESSERGDGDADAEHDASIVVEPLGAGVVAALVVEVAAAVAAGAELEVAHQGDPRSDEQDYERSAAVAAAPADDDDDH